MAIGQIMVNNLPKKPDKEIAIEAVSEALRAIANIPASMTGYEEAEIEKSLYYLKKYYMEL